MKRRAAIRTGTAFVAATATAPMNLEPWARLESVLCGKTTVDRSTVDDLGIMTVELQGPQFMVSPAARVGAVRGHLDELVAILKGPMPTSYRQELLSLAGETAASLAWLRWDLDQADAELYWRAAARAAREAGDVALEAFVQASTSWLPRYRDGDPGKRIEILASAERGSTARTLVWNLMAQAECYAAIGDERSMAIAERARSIMAGIGDDRDNRRPRLDSYNDARAEADTGAAMAHLAGSSERFRPYGTQAQALLTSAVADLNAQPTERRMALSKMVNLARMHALLGDPDGAVEAATQALDGAIELGVTTIQDRLRAPGKLLGALGQWPDHAPVRQLRERLTA